jgi:phosphoribosyl-dephospho-CoA transferase
MLRTSSLFTFVRPHDLLKIELPEGIYNLAAAPSWAQESLAITPYVVVRRYVHSQNAIAIGVRGDSRNKRWPGIVNPDHVKAVVSPFELRTDKIVKPERFDAIPALWQLQALEEEWRSLALRWGPGGSVGYELATGYPTATPKSDLDIVISAPIPFDYEYARVLISSVRQISLSIDVLVETPECGFLLADYASSKGGAILLRHVDKPCLGINPWFLESEQITLLNERLSGQSEILT